MVFFIAIGPYIMNLCDNDMRGSLSVVISPDLATKNRFFLITRLGLILEQKVKLVKYSPSNSLSNDIYRCL